MPVTPMTKRTSLSFQCKVLLVGLTAFFFLAPASPGSQSEPAILARGSGSTVLLVEASEAASEASKNSHRKKSNRPKDTVSIYEYNHLRAQDQTAAEYGDMVFFDQLHKAFQNTNETEKEEIPWKLKYQYDRIFYIVPIPKPWLKMKSLDIYRQMTKFIVETHVLTVTHPEQRALDEQRRRHERNVLLQMLDAMDRPFVLTQDFQTHGNSNYRTVTWNNTDQIDHCRWVGITCGNLSPLISSHEYADNPPPSNAVTRIRIPLQIGGKLATWIGQLPYLQIFECPDCELTGSIPTELEQLSRLNVFDVQYNFLTGSFPRFHHLRDLQRLDLSHNKFRGSLVPTPTTLGNHNRATDVWKHMKWMDLTSNLFTGSLPSYLSQMTEMQILALADNAFEGTLDVLQPLRLFILDVGSNVLTGSLQAVNFREMVDLNVADNMLTGTIPPQILQAPRIETILLSHNRFSGSLPTGNDPLPHRKVSHHGSTEKWSMLQSIRLFRIDHNNLKGTIPPQMFYGLRETLRTLDMSYNSFTGTIPNEIGDMKALYTIDAMGNKLHGTLPTEMGNMDMNLRFNFTDNLLTGSIPGLFCGHGMPWESMNMLYQEFGCDAVLCPPGTFNAHGHATLHSACRPCPTTEEGEQKDPKESTILGRVHCDGAVSVHGDLSGDGVLTPREILRILFIDTIGKFWGENFQTWANLKVHECELNGITCVNGEIAKIDLSNADLCSNMAPVELCLGIPAEIGQLTKLQIIQLTRREYLRGSIPTEIGLLTDLTYVDFSHSAMEGTIPSEIGLLTNLKVLNLAHCKFGGHFPAEVLQLPNLEKLHLTRNKFVGPIPTNLSAPNLVELMIARNRFHGTLPTELGNLANLENIEAYGNFLAGSIPTELGMCKFLKRIDFYNNCEYRTNGTFVISPCPVVWNAALHYDNRLLYYRSGSLTSSSLPQTLMVRYHLKSEIYLFCRLFI